MRLKIKTDRVFAERFGGIGFLIWGLSVVMKRKLARALLTIIIFITLLVIMFGLTTDTGKAILAIIALLSFIVLAYGIAFEVAKTLMGD